MTDFFDQAILDDVKAMMGERYAHVCERFVGNTKDYAAQIDHGLQNSDWDKVEDAAHALKSSSAMMGFVELSELSSSLEGLARDESSDNHVENIKALYGDFQKAVDNLVEYFKREVGV